MRSRTVVRLLLVAAWWPALAWAQTPPPAGTIAYYHVDALGSVRAVTDASGAVVRTHHYHPFGDGVGAEGSTDPLRFTGKPRDAETGLDYFGARYYAGRTGRFTTVDPVLDIEQAFVDPQRWNRYGYSINNPLKFVDPDGRNPLLIMGAAGSAVYGGWQVYQNLQQGRPWHENVGVEASKGLVVGATLGLAASAAAGVGMAADLGGAGAAGTVWAGIRATQPVWEGTVVPRSFQLATHAGQVWAHGNATKHLAEYATSLLAKGVSSELVKIATQAQLSSLQAAVGQALTAGIKYNQIIQIAGWELKFGAPAKAGQLPALIHAQPLK